MSPFVLVNNSMNEIVVTFPNDSVQLQWWTFLWLL